MFRKGHIITEEDIPCCSPVGQGAYLYLGKERKHLHENEAAEILRDICMGEHMKPSEPKEGKIELTAEIDGLFLADTARLKAVNSLGRMMIATRSSGVPVKKGDQALRHPHYSAGDREGSHGEGQGGRRGYAPAAVKALPSPQVWRSDDGQRGFPWSYY